MSSEPARAEDLAAALELIAGAGLPTDGVAAAFPAGYAVVRDAAGLAAVAGLEVHGSAGLLRSVAVRPSHRSAGLGGLLVDDRLAAARRAGLDAVYLLTTTAAEYFRRHGFLELPRAEAPAVLRASTEFASVCPASAVCMRRSVGR